MNELISKILLFVVLAVGVAFLTLCPSPLSPDTFDAVGAGDAVGGDTGGAR